MLSIIVLVIFALGFLKVGAIILRLAWGIAKIIAGSLLIFALPVLILCMLFAKGIALFFPIVMLGIAFIVAKAMCE